MGRIASVEWTRVRILAPGHQALRERVLDRLADLVTQEAFAPSTTLSLAEINVLSELLEEHPLALPTGFPILSFRVYADEPSLSETSAVGNYDFITEHVDGAVWKVRATCAGFEVASGDIIFFQDLEMPERCTMLLTRLSLDNLALLDTSLFEHLRSAATAFRSHAHILMLVKDEQDAVTAKRMHFSSGKRVDDQWLALRLADAPMLPSNVRVVGTSVLQIN